MKGNIRMPYLKLFLLIGLCSFSNVKAQNLIDELIVMDIKESYLNEQVVSHVVKIVNLSDIEFNGTLRFDTESEVNIISKNERVIILAPGDSTFHAFRLVVGKSLKAGAKTFKYSLTNVNGDLVKVEEKNYEIEVRENLNLIADDAPLMIVNPEDSVRVNVIVSNMGNMTEEITLVFNVPEIRGIPTFTERKFVVEPMTRKSYTFSFIASSNLLIKAQFPVHITAMKGKEKKLFGNKNVVVQNVSSNSKFREINAMQSVFPTRGSSDNSISLSYSQYNQNSNMLQVQGGGGLNLPAGYIQLKGNLYKYNTMDTPVATGTSLTYKLYENEISFGNLSEQMEMPMFGRGANIKLSDKEGGKSVTFGAIDQNYNLFSSRSWFSDYYSFYVKGEIGGNNYDRGAELSYLFQRNLYESANFHLSSLKWKNKIGAKWNIDIAAHGAMGNYDNIEGDKFTVAAELRYNGNISEKVMINGSGYYSDPYFPGSRKGSINFSQGVSFRINNDVSLSGSIGYYKTEPKSYTQNYNYNSENSNANVFLSLPKIKNVSNSIYYRHQGESSSSYSQYYGNDELSLPNSMESNRLGWQWRWQNTRTKHSLYGTVEGGVYNNPMSKDLLYQAKSSLNYSYDWLSMDASYQKGAYYLYEYVMSTREETDYYKFTASLSANKDISKRLMVSSGINFTRDNYQGSVPSVNLSMNWLPQDNVALFMNSYWYRYEFVNSVNTYNIQVGLTYTFNNIQQNTGRKSKVIAHVYYDNNANNRFDDGDEPAEDYLVSLNRKVFIADKNGRICYSNLPFGEVTIKPFKERSWFFGEKKIEIDSYRTKINIPLTQSGTLQASIKYMEGEFTMSTTQRYEGIRFTITNNDGSITRTVVSDGSGNIVTFLPNGVYTISLAKSTLPEHTDCENSEQKFTIEASKLSKLDDFVIVVKERKINVKRF